MNTPLQHNPAVRTVFCTALAAAVVVGVAGVAMAPADAAPSAVAMVDKKACKIILKAEQMVEKQPQSPAARATLAQAYLAAGRFESAATTFNDAMRLGDASPRTVLGLALAQVGIGDAAGARSTLEIWRDALPKSDLGLALALAGDTGAGVSVLSDALRAGEDTPKLRQNLAYAYALDGRWNEARVMAAQDVPADMVDERISQWALQGKPEDYRARVAAMLGTGVVADQGQPQHLALAAPAPAAPAVAEPVPVPSRGGELAPIEDRESFWLAEAPRPEVAPEPVAQPAYNPVPEAVRASPVPQPLPKAAPKVPAKTARAPVAKPRAAVAAAAPAASGYGTHMVQLGSFSTEQNAQRAWKTFVARDPRLKTYKLAITPAIVRGKKYWRVAASGFDGGTARSMCSGVKRQGGSCIAYAASRPLPGAVPAREGGALLARR